jgi:hypothetical protein
MYDFTLRNSLVFIEIYKKPSDKRMLLPKGLNPAMGEGESYSSKFLTQRSLISSYVSRRCTT